MEALEDMAPSTPLLSQMGTPEQLVQWSFSIIGILASTAGPDTNSEDGLTSGNGMSTYKNFDRMIGAEPLRRENFTPPFKTS